MSEWQSQIAPLRHKRGFEVLGAWTVDGSDRLVRVLGYDGPHSWEEADSADYGAPERTAIDPDPARHRAASETWLMTAVPL